MNKKPLLWVLFCLVSAAHIYIYYSRDEFAYRSFVTEATLYNDCGPSCERKWDRFAGDYPAAELDSARNTLFSLPGLDTNSTAEQVIQIGAFLRTRFMRQEGAPRAPVSSASPYMQFSLLCRDSTQKLWCGNYAFMMAWFCYSWGITSRIIEIIKPGDHHMVNECYLPEQKKWVLVDLTNNLLFAADSLRQPIHLLGFMNLARQNSLVSVHRVAADTIVNKVVFSGEISTPDYYSNPHPLYYYHRVNLAAVYSAREKVRRYVFPTSWYDIYPAGSNLLFYIKLSLICTWLIIIFALLRLFLSKHK